MQESLSQFPVYDKIIQDNNPMNEIDNYKQVILTNKTRFFKDLAKVGAKKPKLESFFKSLLTQQLNMVKREETALGLV